MKNGLRGILLMISTFSLQASPSGWTPEAGAKLHEVIEAGAGKKNTAFFDLDNTVLCRDIGHATLAVMVRDGMLTPERIRKLASPLQIQSGGTDVRPEDGVFAYYEQLLRATSRYPNSTTSDVGYAWLVQLLQGLSVQEIMEATRRAYQDGMGIQDLKKNQTTFLPVEREKSVQVEAPFFYPEMVTLIATLLEKDYVVRIVSASNVWTVRWLMLHALNPLLRKQGKGLTLSPENIIGIGTVMQEEKGGLKQDEALVRTDSMYAKLEGARVLAQLRVTPLLTFPISAYEGKAMHIRRVTDTPPYFVAGDSQNDYAMLGLATHRLYIARLDSPDIVKTSMEIIRRDNAAAPGSSPWIIQPTLTKKYAGFVADPKSLPLEIKEKVVDSLRDIGYTDFHTQVKSIEPG